MIWFLKKVLLFVHFLLILKGDCVCDSEEGRRILVDKMHIK